MYYQKKELLVKPLIIVLLLEITFFFKQVFSIISCLLSLSSVPPTSGKWLIYFFLFDFKCA